MMPTNLFIKHQAILSLSSNYPDASAILQRGMEAIAAVVEDIQFSTLYYTEPVGEHYEMPFLNGVARLTTVLSYKELRGYLKFLESQSGRTSQSKLNGKVPLDLDIVLWDSEVLKPIDYRAIYFTQGYNQLLDK